MRFHEKTRWLGRGGYARRITCVLSAFIIGLAVAELAYSQENDQTVASPKPQVDGIFENGTNQILLAAERMEQPNHNHP